MRITPKISERPLPTRNNRAPYEIPLKAWISQNCVFIPPRPFCKYEGCRELILGRAHRILPTPPQCAAAGGLRMPLYGFLRRYLRPRRPFGDVPFLVGIMGSSR